MSLPTLSGAQVEWIVQQVAVYIDQQRQTYRPGAVPLSVDQKNAMRPFSPEPALDSIGLVVLTGKRVNNPPFYGELIKMGFEAASLPDFAHMAAITFVDTVASKPVSGQCPDHRRFTPSYLDFAKNCSGSAS